MNGRQIGGRGFAERSQQSRARRPDGWRRVALAVHVRSPSAGRPAIATPGVGGSWSAACEIEMIASCLGVLEGAEAGQLRAGRFRLLRDQGRLPRERARASCRAERRTNDRGTRLTPTAVRMKRVAANSRALGDFTDSRHGLVAAPRIV